jgi:DnaJ-class molecular chaperone
MAKKKCPDCDGKGNDGYHKEEGCITCHGTGEIETSDSIPSKAKEKSK